MINPDVRLTDSAKALIALDKQKKELKDQLAVVQERFEEVEQEVLLMMTNEQVDKLSVGGKTIYPKTNLYASMVKGVKDQAMEYLENMDLGDLVQRTVNARTLASTVKELREDGIELPTELFNVNEKTTIGIRKA